MRTTESKRFCCSHGFGRRMRAGRFLLMYRCRVRRHGDGFCIEVPWLPPFLCEDTVFKIKIHRKADAHKLTYFFLRIETSLVPNMPGWSIMLQDVTTGVNHMSGQETAPKLGVQHDAASRWSSQAAEEEKRIREPGVIPKGNAVRSGSVVIPPGDLPVIHAMFGAPKPGHWW